MPIQFELDTGAALSIVNEDTAKELTSKSDISMTPTTIKLRTYTGELIKPLGQITANVEHHNQMIESRLVVVKGNRPNLMGRDILQKIRLDWQALFGDGAHINNVCVDKLNSLLDQYEGVFKPGLGTMKDVEVDIDIIPESKPIFLKARPVPYAIKTQVEEELERLVQEGIFIPVSHSNWATPVVPVVKKGW